MDIEKYESTNKLISLERIYLQMKKNNKSGEISEAERNILNKLICYFISKSGFSFFHNLYCLSTTVNLFNFLAENPDILQWMIQNGFLRERLSPMEQWAKDCPLDGWTQTMRQKLVDWLKAMPKE